MTKRSRKVIGFQSVPCLGCGARRILGQSCGDCGRKARLGEVNARVVERRTAVRRIEERLNPEVDREARQALLPTEDDVIGFLGDFVDTLSDLVESPLSEEAIGGMVDLLGRLAMMREECDSRPELRPLVTMHRALSQALDSLSGLWPVYARALAAPNLLEAKEIAESGQKAYKRYSDDNQ